MRFTKLSVFIQLAFVAAASVALAAEPADFVFTNGKVYTVNDKQPWAEAVAIKGNKIVYVGDSAGADKLKGDKTEVVDLAGKMVLPGFVSGHEHLIAGAWMGYGVKLFEARSKDEYLKLIKEYTDKHPNEKFILGGGWQAGVYGSTPTAKELDTVTGDRPAIILDFTVHDAWLNTKALQLGGIDKNTKDAVPGLTYWVRDKDGNPTGVAKELAWMEAYVKGGAWQPDKMIPDSQEELSTAAAEAGITANVNQGLITPNVKDLDEHYKDYKIAMAMMAELEKQGKLKLRTGVQYLFKNAESPVDQLIKYATEFRDKYKSDKLFISGIKIHPEGVWTSHASQQLEPFSDQPDNHGPLGIPAEKIREVVMAGNKVGLDISVHTDGTKTNRTTIDSYIAAKEAGYTDARNSLQHYSVVHPDDMKRVIKYKIPVNYTPIWVTTWSDSLNLAYKIFGKKRTETYMQQIRTAIDGCTSVSLAADVPGSPQYTLPPLLQCEAAVTRLDPTDPKADTIFPPPDQAITLAQCLKGYTIEGAWQMRMEDKIGSLEVGKYADLVILEKNLFDVDPKQIADVKVLATMMDGRFTYKIEMPPEEDDEFADRKSSRWSY
jgi:predicted amidohydrolase YtcJ